MRDTPTLMKGLWALSAKLILFLTQGDEQVIANSRNHAQRWNEVMEKSDHSVTLIDLCGESSIRGHSSDFFTQSYYLGFYE